MQEPFLHALKGPNRPQVLLIGNGLERECAPSLPDPKGRVNQLDWSQLVKDISAPNCLELTDAEKKNTPFPLLYSLLSVSHPAPRKLDKDAICAEEKRLKDALDRLSQVSTIRLDELKNLGADHILSTNYSYGLEQSFFPGQDFFSSNVRSRHRFNLNPIKRNGKPVREVYYRLHSGYLAKNQNNTCVGLWHIHGECSVPYGVVLGHDRYGRLLSRIEENCNRQDYKHILNNPVNVEYKSWPQLFLYGDVYILGFGFDQSEFDLWWLLKRKQRERYADGCTFFYEFPNSMSLKQKMLAAHGVEIVDVGATFGNYDELYEKAFADICKKINERKNADTE